MELFPEYGGKGGHPPAPLADRMRPASFEEFLGQPRLLGEGRPLRKLIEKDLGVSFILWGPPGSGKTTIARIAARLTHSRFHEISAVNAGVSDIRKVIDSAKKTWSASKQGSILFIDEIHRFNKAQQDAVLPFVESGVIRLIGSTTENPSFEVVPSLRSRCQIFRLEYLGPQDVRAIVERALRDKERGLGNEPAELEEDALDLIVSHANGDARRALNVLEAAVASARGSGGTCRIQRSEVEGIIQRSAVLYDKDGTDHFDHASAFQKS
ncbi:MAG: AAA family ATPase [Nitrospinae bacterium]|nr:AAA family ATPase [Nitrospinota bacterium]